MTVVAIEDEFERLFRIISDEERKNNSRLVRQMLKIRKVILAVRMEMRRREYEKKAEV